MPNEGESNPNQPDSDDNIYDDFVEFNFSDKKDKYEDYEELNERVKNLLERVNELTKENEELKRLNVNLNKNLSSLLKTAKNEVQRKDSVINELRSQVDSIVFKRLSKVTKDKFTETDNWNYVCKCREKNERSKSKENRISEIKERLKNEEKKNSIERRSENYLICDTRSDYYKEKRSRSPEKYRGGRPYKLRDRSYENSRKSFRYNYKDHLKYDSLDKRRHSSNSRSCSRRKSPREKESRRRSSRDKSKRSRSRSKGRSLSLNTKDSASGKHKSRLSGESVSKTQKKVNSVPKNSKTEENVIKKENSKKEEKKSGNVFEGKSPLDALYDEAVNSWNAGRQSTTDWKETAAEIEEGECVDNSIVEDWMLSFKNERQNTAKPLTLYSRRMMKKFSEEKTKDKIESKEIRTESKGEEKKVVEERGKKSSSVEVEKEPGELTDDENIVESSKEFQELTKVASIESKFDQTLEGNETFENNSFNEPPDCGKAIKNDRKENVKTSVDESKPENETPGGELVEFSPFKNNYKLIEISPKREKTKDHILDLYKLNSQALVPPVPSSINPGDEKVKEGKKQTEGVTQSSDNFPETDQSGSLKNLKKNESKEKTSLPIDIPVEEKNSKQEIKLSEDKKKQEIESVDNSLGRGKRRGVGKKEIPDPGEKNSKKRRGERESEDESVVKKPKVVESCGRRTRSTKEKESEESKEKMKEDISSFEFFKPITSKTERSGEQEEQLSTTCSGAFKMSTTMSFTSVFCLETPIKSVEKLENLTINEQVTYQVNLNEKNGSFSPLITPRRMLKNDLMLTDSEDDSFVKVDPKEQQKEVGEDFRKENEVEEEKECSDSENSEYDSDSGASDFVDLL